MGGRIENMPAGQKTQSKILETEKRIKFPMGFTSYLSEEIANAISGKASKDPFKILSKAMNNYSESPYYKVLKNAIKKTGEAAIWIIDKSGPLINGDMVPYYTSEGFDMNKQIYM